MIEALIAEDAPTGVPRPAAGGSGPGSTASRLVETHTAYVLMVGDRVYKWKKSLDLGFADFRSLASRKHACDDEVRLNRRLAPDVYLGVDVLMGEDVVVTQPVMMMRRLPGDTRLSALLVASEDVEHYLRLVAQKLADFLHEMRPITGPGLRRRASTDPTALGHRLGRSERRCSTQSARRRRTTTTTKPEAMAASTR